MPNDATDNLSMVVCQHTFYLSRCFKAGHILTEDEAHALNQVMIENVRNNVRQMVVKVAGEKGFLDEMEVIMLQEKIDKYVSEYRFRARTKPRARSALETAIDDIAMQQAELIVQRQGLSGDSHALNNIFNNFRNHPEIIEQAKELVLRRRLAVEAATEDLF